ncbi:nucleoporin Nup43 [Anopheles nili]|uniref:nucleoporin Nup43 n=1 Tax=Anopheles nili TaxID=185578 RepID=UPI00237A91ED|nr:nucleoporin Nup43 [Anopheles nili]
MDLASNDYSKRSSIVGHIAPHQISAVRWLPRRSNDELYFVTGSLAETVNSVILWYFSVDKNSEDGLQLVPKSLAEFSVSNDVVGIEMLDSNNVVCATSDGKLMNINRFLFSGIISVLDVNEEDILAYRLMEKCSLKDLHGTNAFGSACSGISAYKQIVATAGEDGYVNIVAADVGEIVHTIKDPNNSSIRCVSLVHTNIVVAGRQSGFLDCYDTRQGGNNPVIYIDTKYEEDQDLNTPTCLNLSPNLNVTCGLECGTILLWDMRNPSNTTAMDGGHTSMLNEIRFAPERGNLMVSADTKGKIMQWGIQNRIQRLMESKSINSIDVDLTHIIAGGDSEMLFMIELYREN